MLRKFCSRYVLLADTNPLIQRPIQRLWQS